jgi:hypothetical protein
VHWKLLGDSLPLRFEFEMHLVIIHATCSLFD